MKSHYVPRAGFCPNCGKLADAATPVKARKVPTAGDVAVCWYCGAVNQYGPRLTLERFDNWREACHPDQVQLITRMVGGILLERMMRGP